ncbi:MAG TPA: HAMP domain-containing sensor histidine kinase [Flavobacteriaceae bacterium]|nr:HAMP domain-containing sensor histidine kinase [Flavobacteriaceae bacterium]
MLRNRTLIRWAFILASLFIISLILWNTYNFFNHLKETEREKMEIWAQAYQELLSNDNSDFLVGEMVLTVIQSNATTPMILYGVKEHSYTEKNIKAKDFDSDKKRQRLVQKFESENTPIEIYNEEGVLQQVLYYGNPPILNKLKYYPALLILILFLFILAIYLFYRTSKSAEQNRLWAGMAKETAHQIGTPLSSLVGWTEILKTEDVDQEYVLEMEKDIQRLETITNRFSKIGSIPDLEERDLVSETKAAFSYLEKRTSKLISFHFDLPEHSIPVFLNTELYSWTIENLVKNGIDAMKGKGTISVHITETPKFASVQITDEGKGLTKAEFKQIFHPGYTTKKRGWGLGLSLAKRIIEEYHRGKIRVVKSSPGAGTTIEMSFRIHRL